MSFAMSNFVAYLADVTVRTCLYTRQTKRIFGRAGYRDFVASFKKLKRGISRPNFAGSPEIDKCELLFFII